MPGDLLQPGAFVDDRYRVDALLGQGGYGAVFRATQLALDRPVALKVLLAATGEALGRFEQEAALVQRLQHPNTVRLLDFGRARDGAPFLVFELLEGRTLDAVLRDGGALPPGRVARVAAQILKALMEAHRLGIVHRDLKPANVFVCDFEGEPDFVKLLDFGIAKSAGARPLTRRGEIVGTPGYVAPEVVMGRPAGPAADLFGVGMVMAETLLGRPLFAGVPWEEVAAEMLRPEPILLPPEVLASPLGAVIGRAVAKQPELRHASAAEMLGDLAACSAEVDPSGPRRAVHGPVASPPIVPPAAPRRRRWPWIVLGGAVIAGGIAAAVWTLAPLPEAVRPRPLAWIGAAEQVGLELAIDDDAVPDLVGLCEPTDGPPNPHGPVDLCGVDGATMKPRWRSRVRGDRLAQDLYLGVAGRTVVVVDASSTVTFLDGRNGAQLSSLRLGRRLRHLCAEAGPYFWAETEDRALVRIDVPTRKFGPTLRAEGGFGGGPPCRRVHGVMMGYVGAVEVRTTVVDGKDGVAVGTESHGASIHVLAGFAASSEYERPARWSRPVAPDNGLGGTDPGRGFLDLAGGRAFAVYADLHRVHHVVSVSAATGKTLWDVKMPEDLTLLQATKSRVYVGAQRRLDVLDAATGKHLGTFGVPFGAR